MGRDVSGCAAVQVFGVTVEPHKVRLYTAISELRDNRVESGHR